MESGIFSQFKISSEIAKLLFPVSMQLSFLTCLDLQRLDPSAISNEDMDDSTRAPKYFTTSKYRPCGHGALTRPMKRGNAMNINPRA